MNAVKGSRNSSSAGAADNPSPIGRHRQTGARAGNSSTKDVVVFRWERDIVGATDRARFVVFSPEPVTLRRVLPLLESLDIEVLEEQTMVSRPAGRAPRYTYEFSVRAGDLARSAVSTGDVAAAVEAAFDAMWRNLADADDFNALILAAGLSWRQVAVLRALGRYLSQTRLPYGQSRIQQVLLNDPSAARALIELFDARFSSPGTSSDEPTRLARVADAFARMNDYIHQVVNLDADRILRAYVGLINATVRTNAFMSDVLTEDRPWLAFKLRPKEIDELPHPRPEFEIFVYSPTVEGVHLRFGAVSRGGVRWSDRLDDYRTEVLGLVKAQAVKNAMIVPAGAKGVFVPKPLPQHAPGRRRSSAGADSHAGATGYRQFIGGLLDLTDNRSSDSHTQSPRSVVCYDAPDPYLVVAADKGTAKFSDIANEISERRGFWLGDAFASGGATGYDHKAIGITARGAWVSTTQHLRQLGIDVDTDDFTAVGIGDMSGDVFGNGMLLSRHLGLIAAFDHRHIFCDPIPNREVAFAERQRLFNLPASSWADYDQTTLSPGGGVWPRSAKTIPVSTELRVALNIAGDAQALTPDELIRAILTARVDLLWNGGVGTYVKADSELHSEVGDKFNDSVRVNASEVQARVITEGGNLGVTARGRIEFARAGGLINSDAIDNAAGVDCSDHEVNIKILLDSLPADSLSREGRADLLASMTDAVTALVLANNRDHNSILSSARHEAPRMVQVHADIVTDLEDRRALRRDRENLPDRDEFAELAGHGAGLTSPQLATLLAHVKLDLKQSLHDSNLFDDTYFRRILRGYFPNVLVDRFPGQIDRHPLRRDIISTQLVNQLVAVGGLTFAYRLADDTGANSDDVVRAYCVASEVFDIPDLVASVRSCGLSVELTNSLTIEARRLLDRAARWLLSHRPQPLDITGEIERFQPVVRELGPKVGTLLQGSEAETVDAIATQYQDQGVPSELAVALSESLYVFSLLDIVEAAHPELDCDTATLAATYFALSDHLGVDDLLVAVSSLPRGDRWHAQARLALRDDLYRSLKALTVDVAAQSDTTTVLEPCELIRTWEASNQSRLQRSRRALNDLKSHAPHNLAALSVAATHIRRMTTT